MRISIKWFPPSWFQVKTKIYHKKGIGIGYVLTIDGKTIYHAGDTDLIPEMEHRQNIDVALLPIGNRDFTMGVSEAMEAVRLMNPKVTSPIHRYESDLTKFKNLIEKETNTKVVVLGIGETFQL